MPPVREQIGWDVEHILIDNDTSALADIERPAWGELLRLIHSRQIDGVIAYHLDRMYRKISDLGALINVVEGSGVQVRTVAAGELDLSTATGRMVARLLASIQQAESERIGERVKQRQQQAAEKGEAHGGRYTIYGYRRAGRGVLELDEVKASFVSEMVARVLKGEALEIIADSFNEREVPTPSGRGRWHGTSIKAIVTNPSIAGLRSSEGEVIGTATWEGIIDELTWRRVVAKLTGKRRPGQPTKYLLTGLLICNNCGLPLRSHSGRHSTTGKVWRTYSCIRDKRWPDACGGMSVSAVAAESVIVGWVLGALIGKNVADLVASKSTHEAARLSAQIISDHELLKELSEDRGNKVIGRAEFLDARAPVVDRIERAEARLRQVEVLGPQLPPTLITVTPESWEALDFDSQRDLVRLIVERVVVRATEKRGRVFDPARLVHPEFSDQLT